MVPVSRVRIAVAGLGGITQSVHLPLLRRRWDLFEIAAVVDLSSARLEEIGARYAIPEAGRFHTVRELVAARRAGRAAFDGVLLATTGSHAPEVCDLVEAGLPVLSEKPLALSLSELDAIGRKARTAGHDPTRMVMVGYMKEHDPATVRARKELRGKNMRAVTVEVLHPADEAQLEFARLLPPAEDLDPASVAELATRTARTVEDALGGEVPGDLGALYTNVVLGSVVHDISLLRHLVGGVDGVDGAVRWGGTPGSLEVTGTVAEGARLHLGWHFLPEYPDYKETVTFHHETGSLRLEFGVPYLLNAPTELTVVSRELGSGDAPGEARTTYCWPQEEAFENELRAFHAMVSAGVPAVSGIEESRADLVVAQRILAAVAAKEDASMGGELLRG